MNNQETLKRPDIEIKVWMVRNDLTMIKIAKGYGVGGRFVSQFVKGIKTSKGLAEYMMMELGCPEEYFTKGRVAIKTESKGQA